MNIRYLGFLLLFGLPGALRAQNAAQPCSRPALSLDWGFVVPEQETYTHGSTIFYSCDSGRKPVVEGWWAAITCENGEWSHEPQCIDETSCLIPEIPHAKYSKKPNEWYSQGSTIRISCDSGYELKDRSATAVCDNGSWSSLPVCEISDTSCGEPPKIPHAVIIGQNYQEVFAADSEVRYECKDGYSAEQVERKTIICIAGNWTEVPTCSKGTRRPNTGRGPSGGDTTSVVSEGTGSRPDAGDGGSRGTERESRQPGRGGGGGHSSGHGGSAQGGTAGGHTTGSGTQPEGGGSSPTPDVINPDSKPSMMPVSRCGAQPVIENGDVVQAGPMFLKYQCNAFYTHEGPDTVMCYNDGTWSQLPSCREAFCVVDLSLYANLGIVLTGKEFVKEGEGKLVVCQGNTYKVRFTCSNGKITNSKCCYSYYYDRIDERYCY